MRREERSTSIFNQQTLSKKDQPSFVTTGHGKIISVNQNFCKLLGEHPKNIIGLHLEELPHICTESQDLLLHRYINKIQQENPQPYQISLLNSSLGAVNLHITCSPYEKNGNTIGETHHITSICTQDQQPINSECLKALPDLEKPSTDTESEHLKEELKTAYKALSEKNNQLHNQLVHINNLQSEIEHLESRPRHDPLQIQSLQEELLTKNSIVAELSTQLNNSFTQQILNAPQPNNSTNSLQKQLDVKNHIIHDLNIQLQHHHKDLLSLKTENIHLKTEVFEKQDEINSLHTDLTKKNHIIEDFKNQLHSQHHHRIVTAASPLPLTSPILDDDAQENLQPGTLLDEATSCLPDQRAHRFFDEDENLE